jgi:hypothetical protein
LVIGPPMPLGRPDAIRPQDTILPQIEINVFF